MATLVVGFGYTAQRVTNLALAAGEACVILSRSPLDREQSLRFLGSAIGRTPKAQPSVHFRQVTFSKGGKPSTEWEDLAQTCDRWLVTVPPQEGGCPAEAVLRPTLTSVGITHRRFVYVSSTSVYGDRNGAEVDETTPPQPTSDRGERRLRAEAAWQALARESGAGLFLLRSSGIYGPGRGAQTSLRSGYGFRLADDRRPSNRIHVDDLAAAAWRALSDAGIDPGIYDFADGDPATFSEVMTYASERLGLAPPPLKNLSDLPERSRSFMNEARVVRGAKARRVFGPWLYPNFRAGIDGILAAEMDMTQGIQNHNRNSKPNLENSGSG